MKPLALAAFLGAAFMAAAALWWVTFRHHHREITMRPDWREPEDGVQPPDPYPMGAAEMAEVLAGWQRSRATGLA